jgi:hypothetical protein
MSLHASANVISNQIENFARRFNLGFSLFASSVEVLDVLFVLGVERLSSVLSLPVVLSECAWILLLDDVVDILGFGAGTEDRGVGGGFEDDGWILKGGGLED